MWFGESHPFPERGSPTKLRPSVQQIYEGWSCRVRNRVQSVFRSEIHYSVKFEYFIYKWENYIYVLHPSIHLHISKI